MLFPCWPAVARFLAVRAEFLDGLPQFMSDRFHGGIPKGLVAESGPQFFFCDLLNDGPEGLMDRRPDPLANQIFQILGGR